MENNEKEKMNEVKSEDTSVNNNAKKRTKLWIILLVIGILMVIGIVVYANVFKDDCTNNTTTTPASSGRTSDPGMMVFYKPIIYLYPENELQMSVKLGNEEKILCSYPKYENMWNIIAKPDGTLIDLLTNRNLYALYYESEDVVEFNVREDGFIVKGTDVAAFLEEKLEMLGLTEREAEEFIIYWLPKLESNSYNYIRFATQNEINENMPLEYSVKPDTEIRVLMTYKGLDKPIEVQEQKLVAPERKGFVVVEWGGTEIK